MKEIQSRGPIHSGVAPLGERDSALAQTGDSNLYHRVESGDSPRGLIERYPRLSALLAQEPVERRAAALLLWLEDQGILPLGKELASLAGETIRLLNADELVHAYRSYDKLGRLPDARAGEKSAQNRRESARVLDTGAAKKKAIDALGERAGGPTPGSGVSLRGRRRGRQVSRRAQVTASDPELTPILSRSQRTRPNASEPELAPILPRWLAKAELPWDTAAALARFINERSLPHAQLAAIVRSGYYAGRDLGCALQLAAVLLDATRHRLIDEGRRPGLERHVLSGFRDGRITFDTVGANSNASYAWERASRIGLPESGIDLGDSTARAFALHELQHLVQDAEEQVGSRYEFEKDGHATAAEFVLRSAGVLTEDESGVIHVDLDAAAKLNGELAVTFRLEAPDKHAIATRLADAVAAVREKAPGYAAVRDHFDPEIAATIEPPNEPFEEVYRRVASQQKETAYDYEKKRVRTDAEIDEYLRAEYKKDGLEPVGASRRKRQ